MSLGIRERVSWGKIKENREFYDDILEVAACHSLKKLRRRHGICAGFAQNAGIYYLHTLETKAHKTTKITIDHLPPCISVQNFASRFVSHQISTILAPNPETKRNVTPNEVKKG